jgi:uncharacterized protein YidB (DUF937 family)
MSWSDALKGAVGNLVGEAEQGGLPALIKNVLGEEGLQSVLAKLKQGGLGPQVASWLDKNRDNLPVTPEQIRAALGDQHVQQIAKSLGIPIDTVVDALAKYLPAAVNEAAPAAASAAEKSTIAT